MIATVQQSDISYEVGSVHFITRKTRVVVILLNTFQGQNLDKVKHGSQINKGHHLKQGSQVPNHANYPTCKLPKGRSLRCGLICFCFCVLVVWIVM